MECSGCHQVGPCDCWWLVLQWIGDGDEAQSTWHSSRDHVVLTCYASTNKYSLLWVGADARECHSVSALRDNLGLLQGGRKLFRHFLWRYLHYNKKLLKQSKKIPWEIQPVHFTFFTGEDVKDVFIEVINKNVLWAEQSTFQTLRRISKDIGGIQKWNCVGHRVYTC